MENVTSDRGWISWCDSTNGTNSTESTLSTENRPTKIKKSETTKEEDVSTARTKRFRSFRFAYSFHLSVCNDFIVCWVCVLCINWMDEQDLWPPLHKRQHFICSFHSLSIGRPVVVAARQEEHEITLTIFSSMKSNRRNVSHRRLFYFCTFLLFSLDGKTPIPYGDDEIVIRQFVVQCLPIFVQRNVTPPRFVSAVVSKRTK